MMLDLVFLISFLKDYHPNNFSLHFPGSRENVWVQRIGKGVLFVDLKVQLLISIFLTFMNSFIIHVSPYLWVFPPSSKAPHASRLCPYRPLPRPFRDRRRISHRNRIDPRFLSLPDPRGRLRGFLKFPKFISFQFKISSSKLQGKH